MLRESFEYGERFMITIHPILFLLMVIVGLLAVLIVWGLWQTKNNPSDGTMPGVDGPNLQLWFFALALFALGVFITYVMILVIPSGM
jgi:hypothetical protein